MQPAESIEGSPTKKPCANIGLPGTADEQSASENINSADSAETSFHAGPVPIYLVPQTISAEIHEHGGNISEITIRRTKHHVYAITLIKSGSQEETVDKTETAGDADAA